MHLPDSAATFTRRLATTRPAGPDDYDVLLRWLRSILFALIATLVLVVVACGSDAPEAWEQGQPGGTQTSDTGYTDETPDWLQEEPADRGRSFSFCIDTFRLAVVDDAAASLREQAKEEIYATFPKLKDSSLWRQVNKDLMLPVTFAEGCPLPPAPSVAEVPEGGVVTISDGFFLTEDKSPYTYSVFIMPREEIEAVLGRLDEFYVGEGLPDSPVSRVTGQEVERDGDAIHTVTWGVYLTPEEVAGDPEFVMEVMEVVAGFRY